jgi:hypothetical protein
MRLLLLPATALVTLVTSALAEVPRTPWGDPDFQGTYTTDNWIGVPMQRPAQFGTRAYLTEEEHEARIRANEAQIALDQAPEPESEFSTDDPASINAPRHWLERPEMPSPATSMIIDPPDGRMPALTEAGQQLTAERRAQRVAAPRYTTASYSNYDRCISRGLAGSIIPVIYGNGTQIMQAPGYVVLRHEMIHESRVIPLDGRPHADAEVRMWMGDSRGHWEGDTLVVETTNFTDRTGIGANGGGAIHSEALRLVERFTRVDDSIRYEFTVHDPIVYTEPWTVRFTLDSRPGYEIFEYACHEGNYGLRNMLAVAMLEAQAERR